MSTQAILSDSRGRLRGRLREVREEVILDVAEELLLARGYGDMSMDELAAQTGMSKATLYHFFPSKLELAVGVVCRGMSKCATILEAAVQGSQPLSLEEAFRTCLRQRAAVDTMDMGLPRNSIIAHEAFRELHDHLHALLDELLERGRRGGVLAPWVSTPAFIAIVEGVFKRGASFDSLAATGGCSRDELIDGVTRIIFHGIRGPNAPA
ncbi:MAG TPA: TetR/AcrR family transcriptional regulator [Chloroflexota bacterium]|nr:TetR/AcrR family transcriptional regulator [Chloroflexota bacterium]